MKALTGLVERRSGHAPRRRGRRRTTAVPGLARRRAWAAVETGPESTSCGEFCVPITSLIGRFHAVQALLEVRICCMFSRNRSFGTFESPLPHHPSLTHEHSVSFGWQAIFGINQIHRNLMARPRCPRGRLCCVCANGLTGREPRQDVVGWTNRAIQAVYTQAVEFTLQRVIRVTSFEDERRDARSLRHWLSRPPAERLATVEFLRRQHHGSGARLQRVHRVLERAPR